MRSQLISRRQRSTSLNAVPPSPSSEDYSVYLANFAARILYRSPLPSKDDLPLFILNAAALPDAKDIDYDALLPYVIARLPDEEELIGGKGYEIVFLAGAEDGGGAGTIKKERPGWGWFLQAYHVLTRAMRKRLMKLYVVHERTWIRLMVETFSTIVSLKFRRKIVHVSCLSSLALYLPIEDLHIPPSAYLYDRRSSSDIYVPYASGKRAFGVAMPLPVSSTGNARLPRVLRESTSFLLIDQNIKTQGIFRVSARAVIVDVLKEAYNRGQKFIVWKEGACVSTFSHWKEGFGNITIEEIEQTEGFGVHPAAALIKRWYAELRDPIFPTTCYSQLEDIFGDAEASIEISALRGLICIDAEWSVLSRTARQILNMHLLPLLSKISEYQDWNLMSPYNLAVCISPNLLRGLDVVEDVKIAGIINRVLVAAICHWKSDLSTSCGMDDWQFQDSLRAPESVIDREDPLEERLVSSPARDTQLEGTIALIDNEDISEEDTESKPALPPRPNVGLEPERSSIPPVRRKPAPLLQSPPRYSTIITQSSTYLDALALQDDVGVDISNNLPRSRDSQENGTSGFPSTAISRKPLPKAVEGG